MLFESRELRVPADLLLSAGARCVNAAFIVEVIDARLGVVVCIQSIVWSVAENCSCGNRVRGTVKRLPYNRGNLKS